MSIYKIDWTWTALDFKICLPILLTLVFFSIYWFTSKSKKIREIFYIKYDHDQASLKHIFFTKCFGFFSMGIFPTIICLFYLPELTLADLGLTLIYETSYRKKVNFILGDIRDSSKLNSILNDFDVVIWLAALVGDGACAINPELTHEINTESVKNLVQNFHLKIII